MRHRHLTCFVSLGRDRDPGSVYVDPDTGRPRVIYTPSAFDRANLLEGVIGLARICHATGALEIHTCLAGAKPFVARRRGAERRQGGDDDPEFEEWLRSLRSVGNGVPETPTGTAHQMGSCRMSTTEEDGVVDPRGRVWGVRDLYVADASVFPSASAVNPQITTMAIADWIARGVDEDLGPPH